MWSTVTLILQKIGDFYVDILTIYKYMSLYQLYTLHENIVISKRNVFIRLDNNLVQNTPEILSDVCVLSNSEIKFQLFVYAENK